MDARQQLYLTLTSDDPLSHTTWPDQEHMSTSDVELVDRSIARDNIEHIGQQHGNDSTPATISTVSATVSIASSSRSHSQERSSVHELSDAVSNNQSSAYKRLVLDTWFYESIAIACSSLCVMVISLLVGHYNGEPIPDLPLGITLNATVSVLSTAARSALIFVVSSCIGQLKWCWFIGSGRRLQDLQVMDEASRGPLGAISILTSRTGGFLANLGAFVTLCMIVFGPFLQQLVDYPTRDVEQPELKAVAPQNLNFTLLQSNEYDSQLMRSLVNAGLVFSSAVLNQTPKCPTARCSWEKYKSVGWCSECRSVAATGYHLQDCNVKKYLSMPYWNEPFCNLVFDDVETQSWSPPFLMALTNSTNSTNEDTQKADTLSHITGALWASPPVHEFVTDDGASVRDPLVVFKHASFSRNEEVCENLYESRDNALRVDYVSECFLSLCESEYTANTTEGITSLDRTSTDYGTVFTPDPSAFLESSSQLRNNDLLCWRPGGSPKDLTLNSLDEGLTILNESERLFCPIENYPRSIRPYVPTESRSVWYFDDTHASADRGDFPKFKDVQNSIFPYNNNSDPQGPSGGNFSSKLEGVAAALTSYGLSKSIHSVNGKVFLPQSYVRVRWLWIELPGFLELASVALLLSTVIYTRCLGVPIWKSSILAICYHRIEELHETGRIALLSEMERASGDSSVQFLRREENSEFVLRRPPSKTGV